MSKLKYQFLIHIEFFGFLKTIIKKIFFETITISESMEGIQKKKMSQNRPVDGLFRNDVTNNFYARSENNDVNLTKINPQENSIHQQTSDPRKNF